MVACWLWPFQVAVTVTLWLPLTVPELAGKVALFWPAGTMTLAGMVSNALLLASETVSALAAGMLKVTVQVLDALLPRVAGVQDKGRELFRSRRGGGECKGLGNSVQRGRQHGGLIGDDSRGGGCERRAVLSRADIHGRRNGHAGVVAQSVTRWRSMRWRSG